MVCSWAARAAPSPDNTVRLLGSVIASAGVDIHAGRGGALLAS
jgi:hypothetical protein